MPKVPFIDHKAIFEKWAGHPAELATRTVIVGAKTIPDHLAVDTNHTMSGVRKPGSFTITPSRRKEQLFV